MRLDDLDYPLPEELIAQHPAPDRSAARLLVLGRTHGAIHHTGVAELPAFLRAGDVVVLNETRVIPARVRGRRPSGGQLELLFVRPLRGDEDWEVLVRGVPRPGETVHLPEAPPAQWHEPFGDGRWRLGLAPADGVIAWLERNGDVPLPPYIRRTDGPIPADRERYQTTYARVPGAVAAPTAGLHFTPELLRRLADGGVELARLTLHVGPGTFLPIRVADLDDHVMPPEWYEVPAATAARIAAARAAGRRVVAVGTTTVRALESAAGSAGLVAGSGDATLFIQPGYRFRIVDALLTNFHLPRSSLLALVGAFAGLPAVRAAYAEAVRLRYRFYSYGDAMLIA